MPQILLRIQSIRFCGFQNGIDNRGSHGAVLCIAEQPVFSSYGYRANSIFDHVVTNLNLSMIQKSAQIFFLKGASASADMYSLVETAKANGLDVFDYLSWLFRQITAANHHFTDEFLEKLMPWSEQAQENC